MRFGIVIVWRVDGVGAASAFEGAVHGVVFFVFGAHRRESATMADESSARIRF